ncbi:MAG TPA: periplasmic heavy metal sensor [Verrucomicrobiae bacterium]|jgi:Spy/CpxP family protein refolding chaperone|nr:periplasmic heavy metal sensor [Verrucomicrobiae bacterium]
MAALASSLMLVAGTSAQTNAPVRHPDGGGQGGFGGRFAQNGEAPILAVLTEDQRTSFRQAMESQRKQLRDWEIKLSQARKDVITASTTSYFDESTVRTKAAAVGDIETEMAVIRARALSQVKPPLTIDEIDRMKSISGEIELPVQPKKVTATSDPSVHPKERVGQRDDNDLPVPGK